MKKNCTKNSVVFFLGSTTPPPGTFFVPHSLALDRTNHTLYVADRENGRVQSFNSITGTFVDEIKLPEFGGVVYAVAYSHTKRELFITVSCSCCKWFDYLMCFYYHLFSEGSVLYVVNGPNRDQDLYVPIQGFTIRIADKAVLQTWPSDKEVHAVNCASDISNTEDRFSSHL